MRRLSLVALVGYGKNTKRNPKKAAIQCAESIKSKLGPKSENFFSFSLISSSKVLKLPLIGSKKVLKSNISSNLMIRLLPFLDKFFQIGVGREDEVFSIFQENLIDHSGIFGSSMDGMDFFENYQFYNDKVIKNSIVSLGLSLPLQFHIDSYTGMQKTDTKLTITKKSKDGRIIKKINNEHATDYFVKIMDCGRDYLTDERIYDIAPYFPLGYTKNGKVVAEVVGYFLGNSIMTSYKNETDDLFLLEVSGQKLLNAVKEAFYDTREKDKKLVLSVSCATIMYTLGRTVYNIYDEFKKEMGDAPFLLLFTGGEGSFTPNNRYIGNETHTQATFYN